ncbi:uncharacterized protein LOC132607849 [Lycium barbarum]|uniref:uncharacterized protein LOC132607849 n=1 Tax=Lycium barbarum TaxID=112863 RepID=UPI00293E2395|nr:uncharacterized protein LOC132607849 [Lycium barbarum]
MRAVVRRFVLRLKLELHRDANTAAQNDKITISKIMAFVQGNETSLKEEEALQKQKDRECNKRAKSDGNFSQGGSQGGGNHQLFKNRSSRPAPSTTSAPSRRSKFNQKGRNLGTAGSQSQASVTNCGFQHPACNTCGKKHSGIYRLGMDACFWVWGVGQQSLEIQAVVRTVCMNCQDVRIQRPHGDVVTEWKGNSAVPRDRFISSLRAKKMISNGCIYHLVRFRDADAQTSTLPSVSVITEFPEVFPDDLPGILIDREIDFGIDLLLGTKPISIPPNRMAPVELKELKVQLKELFNKGFIRPSEGAKVDFQKIDAVKNWPRPTSASDIIIFLDLAGYYRWFVEGFSSILAPLMKLTQKKVKFQWSDECE